MVCVAGLPKGFYGFFNCFLLFFNGFYGFVKVFKVLLNGFMVF